MKKNYYKYLLLISMLLIPRLVYANLEENFKMLPMAILFEAFISIHMSVFVLSPLSNILSEGDSKQMFWKLFGIRALILIIGDLIAPGPMIGIDFFAVFIGAFLIVPILGAVKKKNPYVKNGASIVSNAVVNTQAATSKVVAKPSEYDPIYSMSEDAMFTEFIKKELAKAQIDLKTKLIPAPILKKKKILVLVFDILLFIYISLIFFHFPVTTYFIGLIILIIFFICSRRYNFIKYLKKEIKSRPSEKISNIIMNTKASFVLDNTRIISLVGFVLAVALPLIIFYNPRILYEKTDGGYAVRFYTFGVSNYKTAVIPETYKGEPVLILRGNTFSNMPFLESVKLPDTIKEIRGQAFKNCIKLTDVNIPGNLEYLGGGAFSGAISITRIDFPDTVTHIGGEAFKDAKNLEYVHLPNSLTEIRGNTFENCVSLKSIEIPDSVTRIGGHAFYGNSSLTEVYISPNSKLYEIGSSAFRQCSSLYTITIPYGTRVNERAFKESPTMVSRYNPSPYSY